MTHPYFKIGQSVRILDDDDKNVYTIIDTTTPNYTIKNNITQEEVQLPPDQLILIVDVE